MPRSDVKGQSDPKMKSVSAREKRKSHSTISGMCIGDRGTGKSQFLLNLHKMNVENSYKELYGEDIDWGDYDSEKVREASERCLTTVIDCDLEGQDKLLEREEILPDEILDSFHGWPVTGSPDDTPLDEYVHRFDDALNAKKYYINKHKEHSKKYPKGAKYRLFIVEDMEELYKASIDYFFYVTTRGKLKSLKERFDEVTIKKVQLGKEAKLALFQIGQRDTFGMINFDYTDFVRECVNYKRFIGYHFWCTARTAYKKNKDKDGKVTSIDKFTTGRTYLFEGYLDLILNFSEKTIDDKVDGKKQIDYEYYIDTNEGCKNRMSPKFKMTNDFSDGPRKFFEMLQKVRLRSRNKKKVKSDGKSSDQ
jgi:hypothetical protein